MESVKLLSLIITLTICRPTENHYADRLAWSGRRMGWKGSGEPPENYFKKSLLQIPERGRSTLGKDIGQVQSFKLRARSKSCSRVAVWYHCEGALRSITQKGHSEVTMQSNISDTHNKEGSFVAKTWETRQR